MARSRQEIGISVWDGERLAGAAISLTTLTTVGRFQASGLTIATLGGLGAVITVAEILKPGKGGQGAQIMAKKKSAQRKSLGKGNGGVAKTERDTDSLDMGRAVGRAGGRARAIERANGKEGW